MSKSYSLLPRLQAQRPKLKLYCVCTLNFDRNGNLVWKLFWTAVRKHCFSDQENFWKIKANVQNIYFMNWFYNYGSMCYGQKSRHWPRAQKSKDTHFFCGEFHHKTNNSKNQAKSLSSGWDQFADGIFLILQFTLNSRAVDCLG